MLEGKVKFYKHIQRFGFILLEEGSETTDVFFWRKKGRVLSYEDGKPVWTRQPLRDPKKGEVLVFELKHHPETGQAQAARWAFKDAEDSGIMRPRHKTSVRIFV